MISGKELEGRFADAPRFSRETMGRAIRADGVKLFAFLDEPEGSPRAERLQRGMNNALEVAIAASRGAKVRVVRGRGR